MRAGVKVSRARARILLAAGVLVLTVLACGPGLARAATCDTSWTGNASDGNWFSAGNWDNGVPDSTKNACIATGTAQVTIAGQSAEAKSLTLGGSSGTDSLEIDGTWDGSTFHEGLLTLDNGGSISAHGQMVLSDSCSPSCTGAPGDSTLTVAAGILTNQGTITTEIGAHDNGLRFLNGNITNAQGGVINLNNPTDYDNNFPGGTLDNAGSINLDGNGHELTVDEGNSTLFNDSGGSISNGSQYGYVLVQSGATFKQGYGGTDAPSFANGYTYPVLVTDGATLQYADAGSGVPSASTIETVGQVNLVGGPARHQSLFITSGNCAGTTLTTATSGFTNAGKITLSGDCSGLALTSGTLTNRGTLVAATTHNNYTHHITGSLTNAGALNIRGATAFDGAGATLAQTGGVTSINPGVTFDASGSGATFQLQGGLFQGGSSTQTGTFKGGVDNTGGNVMPGRVKVPGWLTFDGNYTQGPGGKLTEVVDGPAHSGSSRRYGELDVVGTATLAGTLAIATRNDPSVGDFETTLTSTGGLTGQFSNLTGQFPAEGPFPPGWTFGYQPVYQPDYAGVAVDPAAGLRLQKAGDAAGTITSSPSGIDCGTTCDAPFFQDRTVTLTAHPRAGSAFTGWSGGCSGSATSCHVTMAKARTVTATFSHITTTGLTSSRNPDVEGQKVTYTATVSPHPRGGTVKFTSNGATIKGCGAVATSSSTGKAACSVKYSSTGTHKIQAVYSGDAGYRGSASPVVTEKIKP